MTKFARFKILLMCFVLAFSSVFVYSQPLNAFAASQNGFVTGNDVRVRQSPGTTDQNGNTKNDTIAWLYEYDEVIVLNSVSHTDGYVWYYISFTQSGVEKQGYIRSDFVDIYTPPTLPDDYTPDADFEAYMDSQGFPESYKDGLRLLHEQHPEWVLVANKVGLDWNTVLTEQCKVGRNAVLNSAKDSWKSMEEGAYNWETGEWVELDSGGWVAASKEIIAYYLDPRNFLTETGAFLFVSHVYNSEYQNKEALNKMLQGTFMAGTYPESDYSSYSDVLIKAAESSGVNPYVLASMITVEQGTNGTGKSISGTVSGQEGYYNFFNIGAYKGYYNGTYYSDAVRRGLAYAANSSADATYYRPWNTRAKSIIGGAQWYSNNYVKLGQNTHYYKKFNVVNRQSGLYEHQYMTNVQGAYIEASVLKKAYADVLDTAIVFNVPVYNNMPDDISPLPDSNSNNNNFLNSLSVSGYTLTPSFSPSKTAYELVLPVGTSEIAVVATQSDSAATVSGTGKVAVASGNNTIKVVVTAPSGALRVYTINAYVEPERKKGDANGDNKITLIDLAKVQKNILGKETFSDIQIYAADINGDGKITLLDLAKIQKHILGTALIG